MFFSSTLTILLSWLAQVISRPIQEPLSIQPLRPKLHGRFLHITDIHPDPYYVADASESSACHRKKPRKERWRSGYYGTPFSECDSPLQLTNLTLNFLDKNWASEIDFVIWTGDNARHDNDRKIPRTLKEIYDLNSALAVEMENIFLKKGVPVVPSLGNNDIWPHNILAAGPNDIINRFSSIWSAFVPFSSYQVFRRGAYYSVEVIPDEVAIISLNTMYLYDSNKAVGGCEFREPEDPGNLQFDWLEVQLKTFRQRGMQVWITGHVPPSPGNYFPECYVRYVELSLRFQDTILGHLYGHMNNDHFFLLEAGDLQFPSVSDLAPADSVASQAHDGLYDTLVNDFGDLPKKGKTDHDNYGVVNVAPSVVPNPYLPSFRIYTYNITHARDGAITKRKKKPSKRKHGHRRGGGNKEELCKKKKYEDSWRCKLDEPWHSDPRAPSRVNTLWSPLGYAQYYLPEERLMNRTKQPKFKLEYLTYRLEALHPSGDNIEGRGEFNYPIPLKQLPKSIREGNVTSSKFVPYRMDDLTIPSWVGLARLLGDPLKAKLRRRFKQYMYMGDDDS
ncbi:endopolyphosphatase [Multifurca ochricompacta]|uniref:Endopolyphosphatase n=1 Tax=Multifurca ochricompacta TaxID=376703 RepID=A0AAD4MDV6_9AGAM|nr:endopolyphosphatase [Multifurca ochricompacta]